MQIWWYSFMQESKVPRTIVPTIHQRKWFKRHEWQQFKHFVLFTEKIYIEVLLLKISTGGYEIKVTDVNTLILSSFILQIKVCQILNITKKIVSNNSIQCPLCDNTTNCVNQLYIQKISIIHVHACIVSITVHPDTTILTIDF